MAKTDMVTVSAAELQRLRKIEEAAYEWVDDPTREADNEFHAFIVCRRAERDANPVAPGPEVMHKGTNQHGVSFEITRFLGRDFTEYTVHWMHRGGNCSRWYKSFESAHAFAGSVGFYST